MNTSQSRQLGFSPLMIIVAVAVIGLIGYLGYTFYNNSQQTSNTTSTKQSAVAQDVKAAPVITSTSDLDTALSALDGTDTTSGSDSATLNSKLSAF